LCVGAIPGRLTVEADVVIGEDDGFGALLDASHRHMENAVRSLNVMLLQPQRRGGGENGEKTVQAEIEGGF